MKEISIILMYLLTASHIYAQQFSETIALVTDKDNYRYTDTLYISGIVISPDAIQPSSFSNYCTLELINEKGEVAIRQKVRCRHSIFHARIPLKDLPPSDYFILRGYTRFMRNFEDSYWPMVVVGMNNPLKHPVIKKKNNHRQGILQLAYVKKHIIYRYLPPDSLCAEGLLSIYANGRKVSETEIQKGKTEGMLTPDSISETVAYGLVTGKNNEILAGRSVALKNMPLPLFTLQLDSDSVAVNETVGITLKGGTEAVCLMVRLEKVEEKPRHPVQKGMDTFIETDAGQCRQLLTGQYPYSFIPEQVLSIKGSVKTEQGASFKKGGTVIAFNNDTGFTYDGEIEEDGTFEIGVDDFKEGDSFFLQAYNKKGKSYNYRIKIPDENYPGIYFPKVVWEENSPQTENHAIISLDTTRMHWIPEVTVEALVYKENAPSNRFYKKNYVEREEIVRDGLVSLESILRRMPGIRLQQEVDGNGTYIFSTRGSSSLEKKQTVGLYIDGSWVEQENNTVDLQTIIDPADIKTIEYLPAAAAFFKYGVKAFNGVIVIVTRSGKDKYPIRSQGIHYQPVGLSDNRPFSENIHLKSIYLKANEIKKIQWRAPLYAGNYRIVVEAVGAGYAVTYRKQNLTVKL